MKEKKLLIVERSNAPLNFQIEQTLNENNEHNDSIVLTGLFTSFDTKNRNGRIYESADFLPHVDALREQINNKRLLGELDHPHGFEISLANVSHVVESLEYDPQQNAIVGKIRLLNTSKGREAQALVRDGIPLNISSRAAGTVDESGHVRLQQLFTYDLVADPGFANAQLKRVNESYGFGDNSNVDIYDISEDANTDLDPHVEKTVDYAEPQAEKNEDTLKNNNMEDNKQNFIQYSDFQKYSEHLSEIISELQSAIANYKTELESIKNNDSKPTQTFDASNVDNSMIADLVAKEVAKAVPAKGAAVKCGSGTCDNDSEGKIEELEAKAAAMEESYENLKAYTKYIAETLDKSITHQDYISEEANKIIQHNNYLAENMNKMIEHQDYIVENLNDTISYQKYVSEMLDKSIDYSNMLAEEQNKSIAHQDYLAENMNKMISHQDYLAENMNKMISHQDYLAENMNNMIDHQDYIVEEVNQMSGETLNESRRKSSKPTVINKQVVTEKKQEFDSKKYQNSLDEKLTNLISTVKEQYAETKRLEAEAIEESKKNVVDPTNFTLINYMPARLTEKWSKLSDERKQEILAESKMLVINNEASAVYFWNTRDMREKQVEIKKIDESAIAAPAQSVNESSISDERLQRMKEKIQRNMRRY